jgi:hypothetical protein
LPKNKKLQKRMKDKELLMKKSKRKSQQRRQRLKTKGKEFYMKRSKRHLRKEKLKKH